MAPVIVAGLAVLYARRWRLNVLTLHDRVAFSLGSSPARERSLYLALATVVASSAISIGGIVGWVGLLVPHIARRVVRADARYAFPAAMAIGAAFTVVCDAIARTIVIGEVPLGILTSLFGALVFVSLLLGNRVRVER